MKRLKITLLILLITQLTFAQQSKKQQQKWKEDISHVYTKLQERHVDLYHTSSKEKLDETYQDLISDLPSLTDQQILTRLAQFVALVGDGHTGFVAGNQKKLWFKFLPVKLWYFGDAPYVYSATYQFKTLIGKKLISINGMPIDKVNDLVYSTIGADNDMEKKYTASFDMTRPDLLQALGVIKSIEEISFEFNDGTTIELPYLALKKWRDAEWFTLNGIYESGKSPSQRLSFHFASELTLPHLVNREYYWYEVLEDNETIFLQYNTCWDQKNRPSFTELTSQMLQEMDQRGIQKLIIDLRQNSGGEPKIAERFIEELKTSEELVKSGNVYVLVGRRTFSAALTNAAQLRKIGAITVGEPPRGKPNNPSEGRDITTSNKKLWVTVSTQMVIRDEELGDAKYLPVDHLIEQSIDDLAKGTDTVFQWAIDRNNELSEL
ncbi:MAG: S41 family peptidase [bacterium]|nr:S41 family peptidase [bacterium]